jgi:transketolase N-terminal domain/subunit
VTHLLQPRYEQLLRDRDYLTHNMRSLHRLETLNGRAFDILNQAMTAIDKVRDALLLDAFHEDVASYFTCREAGLIHHAMIAVGLEAEAESFMQQHAYDDQPEEGDIHVTVVDDDGTVVGWELIEPKEDDG